MIALALVPSAAIMGMGLPFLDTGLALKGLLRFAIDVALVASAGIMVFVWTQLKVHKRNMIS